MWRRISASMGGDRGGGGGGCVGRRGWRGERVEHVSMRGPSCWEVQGDKVRVNGRTRVCG